MSLIFQSKRILQKILFCFLGSACFLASLAHSTPTASLTLEPLTLSPTQFSVGAFRFTRPPSWKWIIPTSSMRKAQLEIPGTPPGEITFFHFGPGQGGSVTANADRWAGQFTSSDGFPVTAMIRTQEVNKTHITFVSAHGTFANGMPGGPSLSCPNYALCGAILESPAGSVYVKMTGPEELIKQATLSFEGMIKTCHSLEQ